MLQQDFDAYLASDDSGEGSDYIISADEIEEGEKVYLKKKVKYVYSNIYIPVYIYIRSIVAQQGL